MNKTDKLYLPVCARNTVLINVINIYMFMCIYVWAEIYVCIFRAHLC